MVDSVNSEPKCQVMAQSWAEKYRPYHSWGLTFAIFALISSTLLLIIFLKSEKIRKTFRFHFTLIFVLEIFMAVAVILHKSMLIYVMDNRHRADVNAVDRFLYAMIIWGAERTSETVACFLLVMVAAELYMDVIQYESAHRSKFRYIGAILAVVLAFLFEGSDFFRWKVTAGFKDPISGCYFPFRITITDWSDYKKPDKAYHAVYKRWILQIITVVYPVLIFMTIQCFSAYRLLVRSSSLAHTKEIVLAFRRKVALVFCVGLLFYVPEIIAFFFYHVMSHVRPLAMMGLKLNFIVESANFCTVFVFLALDTEVREIFCQLYVPNKLLLKLEEFSVRFKGQFGHKKLTDTINEDSKESDTNVERNVNDVSVV